jgi:hypothetical protein
MLNGPRMPLKLSNCSPIGMRKCGVKILLRPSPHHCFLVNISLACDKLFLSKIRLGTTNNNLCDAMESYCSSCEKVSRQLEEMLQARRGEQLFEPKISDDSGGFAYFGTIKDIFSRKQCPSCIDLAQEITRWEEEDDWTRLDDLVVGIQHKVRQRSHHTLPDQSLYVVTQVPSYDSKGWHLVNFYPLERGAEQDEWGRLFDSSEFDLELAKSWLRCCDLTHGELCKLDLTDHLPVEAFPSRILLVDLDNQNLSYGSLADKYLALSYVWGKANTLRTTRANLHSFLEPGSLDLSNQKIPETIRDFLKLAVRLEIRYAWVDCLCIVQDGEDMQEQLNGMAAIFSSSYLTIVAEGPDANFGLVGLGSGSKLRQTRCPILRLPDMTCVFKDNAIPQNRPKVWETRAWTFQEALFSPRLLFFDVAGFLSWKCSRRFWFEHMDIPQNC